MTPDRQATVWDMDAHKGWGDRISWHEYKDAKGVYGHTTPRPKVGDELRCSMQSGRTGRFRLIEVEYERDPPDMWFGKVEAIGWLDEDPDAPPVTQHGVFGNVIR